jgi:hypothetical protein
MPFTGIPVSCSILFLAASVWVSVTVMLTPTANRTAARTHKSKGTDSKLLRYTRCLLYRGCHMHSTVIQKVAN